MGYLQQMRDKIRLLEEKLYDRTRDYSQERTWRKEAEKAVESQHKLMAFLLPLSIIGLIAIIYWSATLLLG